MRLTLSAVTVGLCMFLGRPAGAEVSCGAAVNGDNGKLEVWWEEDGLGAYELVDLEAEATASADYACLVFRKDSPVVKDPPVIRKDPPLLPKQALEANPYEERVTGYVFDSESFAADPTGYLEAHLWLSPPPTGLVCPEGLTPLLVKIVYEAVTLASGPVTCDVPGSHSGVIVDLPGL